MTFDSSVRLTRVDAPREVAFEGELTGMIRRDGRYLVEPAPEGSRVTLNPHPQVRGIGRLMEPLIAFMGRRLNNEHLEARTFPTRSAGSFDAPAVQRSGHQGSRAGVAAGFTRFSRAPRGSSRRTGTAIASAAARGAHGLGVGIDYSS